MRTRNSHSQLVGGQTLAWRDVLPRPKRNRPESYHGSSIPLTPDRIQEVAELLLNTYMSKGKTCTRKQPLSWLNGSFSEDLINAAFDMLLEKKRIEPARVGVRGTWYRAATRGKPVIYDDELLKRQRTPTMARSAELVAPGKPAAPAMHQCTICGRMSAYKVACSTTCKLEAVRRGVSWDGGLNS